MSELGLSLIHAYSALRVEFFFGQPIRFTMSKHESRYSGLNEVE
jgi:hypothetical protein